MRSLLDRQEVILAHILGEEPRDIPVGARMSRGEKSVPQALYSSAFPEPLPARILFCVFMLILWFFWGRWYAQRVHLIPVDSSWPLRSA